MKKLLLAVVISLTLLSCKKDQDCYHCNVSAANGTDRHDVDYCGEPNRQFQDTNGNDLNSYCVKKN